MWTLERVSVAVERVTGVTLARALVWRLRTGRLRWSLQRPHRQTVERDETEIARWVARRGHPSKRRGHPSKGGGEETCLTRASPTSPTRPNAAATGSGPPDNSGGPSSLTPG
ncbi:helix-turn-helix domain-containing protein [Streptomyces sp. NPDC055189]